MLTSQTARIASQKTAGDCVFCYPLQLNHFDYRWSCGTVTVVLAVDLLPEPSVAE